MTDVEARIGELERERESFRAEADLLQIRVESLREALFAVIDDAFRSISKTPRTDIARIAATALSEDEEPGEAIVECPSCKAQFRETEMIRPRWTAAEIEERRRRADELIKGLGWEVPPPGEG